MPCRLGLAIGSAPRHRRPYMNQLVYEALILHPKEEGEREENQIDMPDGRRKLQKMGLETLHFANLLFQTSTS